jgi:hypothetical protein
MITSTTRDLVARLASLLSAERAALADFLLALADLDRRRGWEEYGYASLYDFLVRELRMSRGSAFYRKTAVALVDRYPCVLDALRDGSLCISTVHEVSRVLTPENVAEVLPRFFGLSRQEAKVVAAELAPRLEVARKELVTTVRAPAPALSLDLSHEATAVALFAPAGSPPEAPGAAPASPAAPPPARPTVDPMTATEHRLHLTVSPEFLGMLDACKKALSHSMPGADAAAVLEEGMKLILAKDAKKKALTDKPRPPKPDGELRRPGTRYIPAEVRRAVWKRDQGRCQWPVEGGGICGCEIRPELDHVHGFQPGVSVEAEDLRVLCRRHNLLHARQVHGDAYMASFGNRRRRTGAARPRRPREDRADAVACSRGSG